MDLPPKAARTECVAIQMMINPVGYRADTPYQCGCSALAELALSSGDELKTHVTVEPLDSCDYIDAVLSQRRP